MIHNNLLPNKLVSRLNKEELCIFLFHGVVNKNENLIRNYTGKHINSNLFNQCMKELKKFGNPISMHDVLDILINKKKFLPFSFAITFDDGFENNISVAAPILEELKIPSIIYLTTKFIDQNDISWTDKIEYIVENTSKNNVYEKNLKKIFYIRNIEEKINYLNFVRKFVKNNNFINPINYANNLSTELEVKLDNINLDNQLDKKISWNQIRDLKNNKYISFGGHSHTHRILSFLSKEELKYELETSIKLLKEKGDLNTAHYSYPEGLSNSYSKGVIKELIKLGIKCCPTAIDGTNKSNTDPFELKRIMVG